MIPCLYDSSETEYADNGIGKLSDCQSCVVTEKRNGSYELKMEYPAEGIHADYLQEGNIILAKPADQVQSQPFRIYKITTPLSGKLEICARHISYQLNFITVSPLSASGCPAALAALKSKATTDCPFTFWTDLVSGAAFNLTVPVSLRGALGGVDGSVLDTYGGEYEWDRYTVRLHQARGRDNGVRIVYGKNLIDFKMERNIENVITGVHPYWKNQETGAVLELPEKVITVSGRSVPYERIVPYDCTEQFESQPSVETLRNHAASYLKTTTLTDPNVDITIDFLQLWETPGYEDIAEAERVQMCDTVWVYISKLGIEVSSKVTETEYDTLLEKYKSVTLSNSVVSSRSSSLAAFLGSIKNEASNAYQTAIRVESSISDVSALAENQGYYNVLAAALMGLHYSSGTDNNGNVVRYAYNAVSLEASTRAWRSGPDGLFYSTNGGKTWQYGWDTDYQAVSTVFDTLSILAGQIRGGTIDTQAVRISGNAYFFWTGDAILLTDPQDTKRMVKIGLYADGRYGIAVSADGGATWEEGLGFDGVKLSEATLQAFDERYGKAQVTVSEEAPSEPKEDTLWIDKTMNPKRLKLWNGTDWEIVGYEPPVTEPSEPSEPNEPGTDIGTEPTEPETDTGIDTGENTDTTTETTPVTPEEGVDADAENNTDHDTAGG